MLLDFDGLTMIEKVIENVKDSRVKNVRDFDIYEDYMKELNQIQ
jgi:hypothetical protein